jgi:hypothetical protein
MLKLYNIREKIQCISETRVTFSSDPIWFCILHSCKTTFGVKEKKRTEELATQIEGKFQAHFSHGSWFVRDLSNIRNLAADPGNRY